MFARLAWLGFLIACGGSYGGAPRSSRDAAPARGIAAAALPYSVVDARTGRAVELPAFWNKLGSARVVCVGEEHPNPHHHWFQLEVVTQLVTRKHASKLALGMEMFQRPFQGVLDDYAARKIDVDALLSRTGYEERWGYDYGFYGPTIDKAVAAGGRLLALNAPRELVKKIVRHGLDSLTPDEKKQVPELVLDDKAHRAWFDATMESMGGAHGHGKGSAGAKPAGEGVKAGKSAGEEAADKQPAMPSADRIYTAQVLWDETMAEGAAAWLAANPNGYMVLLAGNGHCHDSAIVRRIERRGVAGVVSVRPVLDIDGKVAEALAKPMNDFVVVLELPPEVKKAMTEAR